MKISLSILFSLFFLTTQTSQSQDTIFYDKDGKETKSLELAENYKVITYGEKKGIEATERYYSKLRQIKSESFYSSYKEKELTGKRSVWRESGELYLEMNYKKNKKDGPFIAYWENGREKRRDIYKKGKLVEGKVWDREGLEADYFPFHTSAEFPGGRKMMINFLKENALVPVRSQTNKNSTRVNVKFTVEATGEITDIQITSGGHDFRMEAYRLVNSMPPWSPAIRDGTPIKCSISLPIVF